MIYKCKMCGGSLEIKENETIAVCEYCGTKQTLPKLDSEKKSSLLDRANHFRRNNEYDKAATIYEQILADEKTDAEVYWLIVLCRYGIDYVEDPSSHKRIPTVNRVQYTSILNDEDYLKALEYADLSQKDIYIEEANKINEIQKGILEISNKEEPFDIFICYKETDENGRRTEDSVIAQDIYKELTNEDYKVFFSRITLEDKIGTAYEPYIFAALNSAKVMLVIGTKKDYFNAVWVKNEWSRYLALINKGEKKSLVPCYKNMDPYDMPEEFAYLQAQDLNKLGFTQDLIRGIEKIIKPLHINKTININDVSNNNVNNINPLLERANIFLETGKWDDANKYCEKVLDINPKNSDAYMLKMFIDYKVHNKKELLQSNKNFENNENYQNAFKYATEAKKQEIENFIKEKNLYINEQKYVSFIMEYNSCKTIDDYENLLMKLNIAKDLMKKEEIIEKCKSKIDELVLSKKENAYNYVIEKVDNVESFDEYNELINKTESIKDYKDSNDLLERCYINRDKLVIKYVEDSINSKIINRMKESINYLKLYSKYINVDDYIQKINIGIEKVKRKRAYVALLLIIIISTIIVISNLFICESKYNKAIDFFSSGDKLNSYKTFMQISSYKNSNDYINNLYQKIRIDYDDVVLCSSSRHTVAIKSDGTVVATGDNSSGQCDVSNWKDIVSICAGLYHTVGLKADGTVVATGENTSKQCDVSSWKGIVSICAGSYHTVGLKADGSVVGIGSYGNGQCDVSNWSDIVSICAGSYHTIGLKADGTVVATGDNSSGQCDVSNWTDIVEIFAGPSQTFGLKSNGSVVAAGYNGDGQLYVSDWTDIVFICTDLSQTFGLKLDGTVVATRNNRDWQFDVSDWTDIVSICAGSHHIVGLKADGTVVAKGSNAYGQCCVSTWSDIKMPKFR